MNKKYLFIILVFMISSVSAFSLNIELAKESYSPGETLQADILIDGYLEENIGSKNIKLLCSNNYVSIAPSIIKVSSDHYYSFFSLDQGISPQNCEFVIEDVIFYQEGFIRQADFNKNFSILATNDSIVSINPAAFKIDDISVQNNFQVYVENLGDDTLNLSIFTQDDFVELSLGELSGDPESASYFEVYLSEFLYSGEETAAITLNYDTREFEIPIWIFEDDSTNITIPEENNTYVDESKLEFVMDVDMFNISLGSEEDLSGYVTIKNVGESISNILFSLTGNVGEIIDLQATNLDSLSSGESYKEYLYVNQLKNAEEGIYQGTLKVDYSSQYIEFPIFVEIKSGEIVGNGSVDNGDPVDPGVVPDEGTEFNIWWIVLLIILIALIAIYFLYKKKTKKNPDFLPQRV